MVAFNTKPKGSTMSKIKAMPKINKVLTAVIVVALILCLFADYYVPSFLPNRDLKEFKENQVLMEQIQFSK